MGTLTTDKEEALLRGYIPLAKEILESLNNGQKIEEIYFHGNGYVTDAVLQLIKRKCKSKDVFSNLSLVNLVGSDFITDYGIRCLLETLDDTSKLQEVDLSGCRNVSDSSFALLYHLHTRRNFRCGFKGTGVTYLTGTSTAIETQGCPCLGSCGSTKEHLHGQVLIVPHSGMKKSLGRYLQDGSCTDAGHGYHHTDTAAGKWTMAITEVASSSNLFDHLTNSYLTQVIIPFEADAEPSRVKQHIMSTIAKVVAKEPVTCKFPDIKPIQTGEMSSRPWLDMHKLDRLQMMTGPDGCPVLRNVSTSEKSIGVYISRTPLTRSNNYFEVVMEPSKDKKLAILVGCLYDHLFSDRHPMDSTSDVGGYVDGFEAQQTGEATIIGFGIEGEWLSEYLPSKDAKYYFSHNGVKKKGKVESGSADMPRNGMYPLACILGEIGSVKLPPLVSPPQELIQQWKREKRWIEKGYTYNCMVDNYGNLRYCSNYESSGNGYFLGMNEVKKDNDSFTMELVKLAASHGGSTELKIGIAGETYRTDKVKDAGVIELSIKLSPYYIGWACDDCKFENEGHSSTCVSCKRGKRPQEAVNPTAWKCTECQFPNEKHIEKCTSCKKGVKPQGYGEWRQEIFTQINSQIETKVVENLTLVKEGDTFSVTVSDISDSPDNVTKVVFYHNDKQIIFRNFVFSPTKKCRPVPFIQLANSEDHVRLKNFRPTYRKPAPFKNKVTVGRANFLAVSNDGTVEYKALNSTARTYGLFMAKTPFNRHMLEFTVEAMSLGSNQLFGIGVCDPDYPSSVFIGWKQGSVGYHADNGGIYDNHSSATFEGHIGTTDIIIASGSVVAVRVGPKDADTLLKFDADGHVDSQQVVKLLFVRDGVVVHEILHEILGQGIYPSFSLKAGTVKIRNFYAESTEVWDQLELAEKETKRIEKVEKSRKSLEQDKAGKPYCGTEFIVVGVSSGASDASGKLQIVQQQIDLNEWAELKNVTAAIGEMEKKLEDLSLQDQKMYGQLCAIEDNMKLLVSNPGRITYHKADLANSEMRQDLLHRIADIQDRHRALQSVRYNTSDYFLGLQQEVIKELERSKVLKVNKLLGAPGMQDSGTKKEGSEEGTEDFSWLKKLGDLDGNTLLAQLQDLQNKGKLVLLDLGSGLVAADIGFLLDIESRMGHLLPTQMMNISTMVRCIGQTSHVWSNETFESKILAGGLTATKGEEIKLVLEQAFALMRLQCLRTSPEDEKYIFVTQQNITNPPVSMVEFWNPHMDNTDFVVMRQTYSFPLSLPENLVSLIISNTAKYGRIVILTGEGVVYQNGAVQTVIVGTQDSSGENAVLIESRCYMPSAVSKEECGMTKQTVSYVQDYTWNIFSTFTDIIDDLLQRSRIVVLVTKDWPQEMVNVSIGCKHCWVSSSSGVRQTVCTLCNMCCSKGSNCAWNGIMGDYLRQCGCGTDMDGCKDCGICTRCAEELWDIRSRLRPFSTVMTEVLQSTEEKIKMKKLSEDEKPEELLALRDPVKQPSIALDPFCYNEVEFTNFSSEDKILCLKEESVGTVLQAYPGRAKKIEDASKVDFKEIYQDQYKLSIGDQIKLRISDPLGAFSKAVTGEDSQEEDIVVETQYFSLQAREVKVMQETGIVMYDTTSPTVPVGQFIGCKPMTRENNNFSIRILCSGQKNTISLGLAPANYPPNRQPGWNSQSIGYHADDGGIFLESGYPTRKTKIAKEGDIMSLYIDFDKDKGWFRKNGEKCIELNLNPSRLGYYPIIGFHSIGEAVQIIEKELWVPATEEDRNRQQPSLPTYKYGNLWISPGKRITLVKLGKQYCGWIILHNPQKDPVGFKVRSGRTESDIFFGVIQHKKDWIKAFRMLNLDEVPDEVTVEWSSLESGRDYTIDDMKKIFGVGEEYVHQSGHQHRLPVMKLESANIVEELPKVSSGEPKEQSLCLHVYRNLKLVDEYWLKLGNYQVMVESNTKQSKFLLKYPKCPGFNYGKTFQKGMKMIAYLESSKVFAESIVVDVYSGGRMVALEYSPKDKSSNMTICVMAKSPALTFTDFNEDGSQVWRYEARNTPTNLTRTFYSAPPYLLSEGAIKVLNFINKEWKSNVLKTFSVCYQVFTRLTVQEKQICSTSRTPLEWVKNGSSNYLYTFLPSQLSDTSLIYPIGSSMYRDISVHRMCFSAEELMTQAGLEEEVAWRIPLHYVDAPGIVPSMPLPPEATFGDGLIVWTYISLISNRLHLPSYKNMIKGDLGSMPRAHVEQLLYNLLQIYSALCSIYSATWGGVEFSQTNEEKHIKEATKHDTNHIVKFSGKPQTETDMLFRKSGFATCKAHCMAMRVSEDTFPDGVEFDYSYFEPYTDLVNMFHWSHTKLSGLPEDFFEKFKYLQYFRLGMPGKTMHRFTKLPEGISKCKLLKVIEITEMGMTQLPSDFFLSQSAVSIFCTDMPIKHLPERWPETSQVSELVLSGLLLTEITPKLSCLENLERLELCYNPITDLPESLDTLKKLKVLYLTGAHWLTLEGKKSQMTHEQYETWHLLNPATRNYFGREKIEELFKEFDFNHNGSLDEEELAALNLKLFFGMPRIGLADINDEVTGGIPKVVFSMNSLNELHLDYCAITTVPQAINNLQNLNTLSLNHNPLLMSLPGSLGHLPNIKGIQINSCPAIRTPPTEVVSRGFESVKAYLKRLAGGYTECRRTKLMLVGLGGAGKTSLLRALMSAKKMTSGTEDEIPTDGIDIVPWTVASEDGQEVTYSTWDFAGQAVYYNTHQFFLSKRAVYLLLWSMRQGYEHAGLDFWLSSICCHAPGTPILVIGTQCDLIPQAEIPEKELKERYPQIAGFHQVSSIKGTGIEALQKNLLDITLQQGYMGEKIPQVWLNFERRILAERLTKKNYLKWEVARRYAMEQGIYDEKDVRLAIQLLHDLGTVQYFDNDFLRDYVVINPQWIVNVMACVVSAQDSPIQKHKGRFLHKDIPTVWQDYSTDLHSWLLRLTEDFDLTFPLPKEAINIVPCLLPSEAPEDLHWPKVRGQQGIRETKMVYRFTYLPSGLFNRAQVRLFQFSDGKMVWKKGSLLSKNKHLALIKQTDSKELVVFVQGPRPENIVFLIHEVFESIIEESFNGVYYEMFLPCPDCVLKEGTSDPDLLNAKLIQRAKDMKAPFLQCYKYFHWISMAQLQEKLPADSREVSDFDMQLQQSIVALQELNNDLMMDVAIIYSSKDVPPPGDPNRLPPALIRDDVVSWGYSCWFAEDMDTVSYVDLTAAIKNCKVLMALVSDDFEADTKCCDMFIHAKETMNKDIIIVPLGESLQWQDKDLGIKIGKQERMLMAKNLTRYTNEGGRREELKTWLAEKIAAQDRVESDNPDVFVSYAWTNSKEAQERSGKVYPAGLGWGDPRGLKAALEGDSVSCWLDIEQVGREKQGIFADMAAGIRNSKVILACISDEYAESDNCMMELRFGILNMNLPLVVAIVGKGSTWKETEVAMLVKRARAPEVYLQMENTAGIPALVKFVKNAIVDSTLSKKKKKKKMEEDEKDPQSEQKTKADKKAKEQTSSIAYKEEYELVQRKFMRHILGSISTVDTLPLPRLMVIDFVKAVVPIKESDGRESKEGNRFSSSSFASLSKKKLRPKSGRKSRDRLQIDPSVFEDDDKEDWSKESFCLRLLCENEAGWHLCSEMLPLAFRTRDHLETFMKKSAPYLYRIYSLLSQSPIKLKCFAPGKGQAYQDWIRRESEVNADFVGAMQHLRSELTKDEASDFLGCLARCRLPSGKILWLCEEHQHQQHVAKLSTSSSGGSYSLQKVLFNEDKLFLENLEKSVEYKALKSKPTTKVAPVLPQPVPIPMFVPQVPPPAPEEGKKPQEDEKKDATTEKPQGKGKEETQPQKGLPTSNDETDTTGGSSLKKEDPSPDEQSTTTDKKDSSRKATHDGNNIESSKKKNVNSTHTAKHLNMENIEETERDGNEQDLDLDQEALKEAIKQDVIESTRRKSTVIDGTKGKSSLSTLNKLVQSNMKPIGISSQRSGQTGKSGQLQRKGTSQNFGAVQRGSTVRRQSSNNMQPSVSHRSVPENVSNDLKLSLKINTVGDLSNSSNSNSATSSASGVSKPKGKTPTEKSPLEKVRPRKINVTPKSEGKSSPRRDSKTTFKATGIAVGTAKLGMSLPEQNGSKACVLQ